MGNWQLDVAVEDAAFAREMEPAFEAELENVIPWLVLAPVVVVLTWLGLALMQAKRRAALLSPGDPRSESSDDQDRSLAEPDHPICGSSEQPPGRGPAAARTDHYHIEAPGPCRLDDGFRGRASGDRRANRSPVRAQPTGDVPQELPSLLLVPLPELREGGLVLARRRRNFEVDCVKERQLGTEARRDSDGEACCPHRSGRTVHCCEDPLHRSPLWVVHPIAAACSRCSPGS